MSYRQSMLPPLIPSSRKIRQAPETPYRLLDFHEIAVSLNMFVTGFVVSEDLLVSPTSHFVTAIYSEIVSYFVGIADQHMHSTLMETNPQQDTENQSIKYILFRHIRKFLADCGVDDFTMSDMIKPESARLRRHLSAILAYANFREIRMSNHDHLIKLSQEDREKFHELWRENEDLMQTVQEIESHLRLNAQRVKQTLAHNSEVEAELRRLQKVQEQLTEEYSNYKQEKKISSLRHSEQSAAVKNLEQEISRIRRYLTESPQALGRANQDLHDSIEAKRSTVQELEKQTRNVDITLSSLRDINSGLETCTKVLDDFEQIMNRAQDARHKLARRQEHIEQRKAEASTVDIRKSQVQTQLENSKARMRRAEEQAEQKLQAAETKMRELRQIQAEKIAQRTILSKQMDERRGHIEAQERRMKIMKDEVEKEMKAIASEADKLEAHIQVYLKTMSTAMLQK